MSRGWSANSTKFYSALADIAREKKESASLEIKVGSVVRVAGLRPTVTVTDIRPARSGWVFYFTCPRSGGTRSMSTEQIRSVESE